jgi:Holliday junction DNA helicase RuvA
MIERLRGEVIEKRPGHVVVMAGGVGYGLDIPLSTHEALPRVGQQADLFVHTHVREDTFELFGFATREEREAFLVLQRVSGIGPVIALAVLSEMSPGAFARAVESGRLDALTQVKGVGKRTAERLVLELKGKLKSYGWAAGPLTERRARLTGHPEADDAVAGLVTLGMKESQAEKAVAAAISSLGKSATVKELIVESLKHRK